MRKCLLTIVLITTTLLMQAQFGPRIDLCETTATPSDAKAIDLDGDGDLDILVATRADGKIMWFENLGNGNFGPRQNISTNATLVNKVYGADMDGDGDSDIIAFSYSKIMFFENMGNGTFGSEQIIVAGIAVGGINLADLDGDGDIDILATSVSGSELVWFENLGDNLFNSAQVIVNDIAYGSCIGTGDFDQDGDLDLIITTSNPVVGSENGDKIVYYENLGDGTFGEEIIIHSNDYLIESLQIVDLDGDGELDILVGSRGNNTVSWHKNLGDSDFSTQQVISINVNTPTAVFASDLNQDGHLDVLFTSFNDNEIFWSKNMGDGTFGIQEIIATNALQTHSIFAADLDGDGDPDVLVTDWDDDIVAWYENQGNGNFGPQNIISVSECRGLRSIDVADLDGDGYTDVVSVSSIDNKIAWYRNLGNGTFGPQQIILSDVNSPWFIHICDLDGDGDMDILVASRGSNKIVWFENLGGAVFSSQQIISSQINTPNSVYTCDLDGDGDLDVVATSYFGNKVVWFENLGDGNFGAAQVISSEVNQPIRVYPADLNNDGDVDVISISYQDNKIAWYENLGGGVFGPQQIISADVNNLQGLFADDLDGDGNIDVLCASVGGSGIAWYKNLGDGSFGDLQSFSQNSGVGSRYVSTADINADGKPDVVASSTGIQNLAWFENLGSGNFGLQQGVYTQDIPIVVVAADIDNDGYPDLIAAFEGPDRIGVFKNYLNHSSKFSGSLYYDINLNGIRDSIDVGLDQVGVYTIPQSDFTFTDTAGNYVLYFSDTAGTYQIIPGNLTNWSIVSDSLTYTFLLDSNYVEIDSLDFGFFPDSAFKELNVSLFGGIHRCDSRVNFWMTIQNVAPYYSSGYIQLQLDNSISYISSSMQPDSIIGQNIFWHYDLFTFSSIGINLIVDMPSGIGLPMSSILTVYELDDENAIIYSNSTMLNDTLICSFDPNDKAVSPAGIGTEGYIIQDQELEYLIRFQNTGTDTAFTVTIKDQLDTNLNWLTLDPIASSHPMQIQVDQNGKAVFKFQNILLPDSNVNYLGSQGYLAYRIKPHPGLLPNTSIVNTAYIYFDQNLPVVTNTVLNTIECYGTPEPIITYSDPYLNAGVTGSYTYEWYLNGSVISEATENILTPIESGLYSVAVADTNNCFKLSEEFSYVLVGIDNPQELAPVVFPNPFSKATTITFTKDLNGKYDLVVYNILGVEVRKVSRTMGNRISLPKGNMGSGVYLTYLINNETKQYVFIEKLIVL